MHIRNRAVAAMSVVILVGSTLAGRSVHAQVNTEAMRHRPADTGLSNRLNGTFSFQDGNTEYFKVGIGYRADYLSGDWYAFLVGSFEYGEESDEIYVREAFGHARLVHSLFPRVRVEGFVQRGFDDFLSLKDRFLAGGGGRLTLLDAHDSTAALEINLGVGAMYESEKGGTETISTIKRARSTNYLAITGEVSEHVGGSVVTYVQPALSEFSDYRVLLEGGIYADITDHLALTVSVRWRFDSQPFPEVEKHDIELENGVAVRF